MIAGLKELEYMVKVHQTSGRQTTEFHIPEVPWTDDGSIIFGAPTQSTAEEEKKMLWLKSPKPGRDLRLESVAIGYTKRATINGARNGGEEEKIKQQNGLEQEWTTSPKKGAYTARIAPETPFILLPEEAYKFLASTTVSWKIPAYPHPDIEGARTSVGGFQDVVDCSLMDAYPDLVFRFAGGKEVVVGPRQYIEQVSKGFFKGKCVLLVRKMDEKTGEVVLGWGSMRGRSVVLDWEESRTGLGR